MHIEPGVVDGAKIILSYATAAGLSGSPPSWRLTVFATTVVPVRSCYAVS